MADGVNDLSAEEDALYDMSDEDFEVALAAARAEQDQGNVGDDIVNQDGADNSGSDGEDNGSTDDNGSADDDGDDSSTNSNAIDDDNGDNGQGGDNATGTADDKSEQSTTDSDNDGEKKTGEDPAEVDADAANAGDADKSEPGDKKPQTFKYKANGQEFEFTEAEIKERFGQVFGQSMNYTQKMQELKPWRTTISALQDNKMSHADVELMIDVMKGDKGAMNKLMERTGVNPMELDAEDEEQTYQPQQYGKSDVELEIDEIVNEIARDPEYAITQDVLGNRWDQASRDVFLDNPSLIKKLHVDVKNGDFDVLSAEATKLKLYDGGRMSDIEYYAQAAQRRSQMNALNQQSQAEAQRVEQARIDGVNAEAARQQKANNSRVAEVKAQEEKRNQIDADAQARKNAAIPSKASGKKTVVDYLDDDDEAYNEWYKKLEASI